MSAVVVPHSRTLWSP